MIGRVTIICREHEYTKIKIPNLKTQEIQITKKYKCKSLIKQKIQEW